MVPTDYFEVDMITIEDIEDNYIIVEKSFYTPEKEILHRVKYLRSDSILMIDYDLTHQDQIQAIFKSLWDKCREDRSLCYWMYITFKGLHVTLMSEYFEGPPIPENLEFVRDQYPYSDPIYFKACHERHAYGYRLTPKLEHPGDYVAQFACQIGFGEPDPGIAFVMNNYTNWIERELRLFRAQFRERANIIE